MCKVSVVLPSKNVVKYIGKCLDSVIGQTLEDIEIICVDAFSNDGTRDIIKEYQAKDHRILLLDDDKGSSGYADNLGFHVAKGDYVGIVETDDYIKPTMLEVLYQNAAVHDLDYIKADYSMFVEDQGETLTIDHVEEMKKTDIYGRVIHPADYPELLQLDGYMWKGIYKKEFIEAQRILLNETKGAAYQDNGFLHQTISLAQRAMYIHESFYQYRRDNENASDYHPRGLRMMLEEYRYIENFIAEHKDHMKPFMKWYYYKMFQQFKGQLKKMVRIAEYDAEAAETIAGYIALWEKGFAEGHIVQDVFGMQMVNLKMLMKEPELFFSVYKCYEKEWKDVYQSFLKDFRTRERVVLVCCGDYGTNLYILLRRNGINNIVSVCDNSEKKQGAMFYGYEVLSVERAAANYRDSYFCIAVASRLDAEGIKRQLVRLAVPQANIIFFGLDIFPHLSTSFDLKR